eukprot:UN09625
MWGMCDGTCVQSWDVFVICRCMRKREMAHRSYLRTRRLLLAHPSIKHVDVVSSLDMVRVSRRDFEHFSTFTYSLLKAIERGWVRSIGFPKDWNTNSKTIVYFLDPSAGNLHKLYQMFSNDD